MSQNLARRSISSAKWNALASVVLVIVGFIQTTILARLLPVDIFGVYAAANAVVDLTTGFASFGMASSFLFRSEVNQDIERSAAVHFTLKLILTGIWTAVMLLGIALLVDPAQSDLRTAFLVLTLCNAALHLNQTPRLILNRQVTHQRLAIMQIVDVILTTIVTVALALNGATLWALLASNIISVLTSMFILYVWRPVWRPRLLWYPEGMRFFLSYGAANLGIRMMTDWLDRLDDTWTGTFLGKTALGFYSKAYGFAKYPSIILASTIDSVSAGTYAELMGDRPRLSQAFYQANALLVRSGFLLAGLISLIAPEFIVIVIGERWLPMMDAFRLMLVFTLFDPMKRTIANLFTGIGKPRVVVQTRFMQLIVMGIGLFGLGPLWGIAGVALAVDLMLVVGMAYALWRAKEFVDYSLRAMLLVPGAGLVVGLLTSNLLLGITNPVSPWLSALMKIVVFTASYAAVLWVFERRELTRTYRLLKKYL
jgi:O-antigen/teichoic acid export membrane protein